MAQQLRVLATFPGDQSTVPSSYVKYLTVAIHLQGSLMPPASEGIPKHTCITPIYIHVVKNKFTRPWHLNQSFQYIRMNEFDKT